MLKALVPVHGFANEERAVRHVLEFRPDRRPHGRTGMSGLPIGSIATKVFHLSSVPVTLVK